MGSKSYTTVTDDRDVATAADEGLAIVAQGSQVTVHSVDAELVAAARAADVDLAKAFLDFAGEARAGEQALLDAALSSATRSREADQALLAAALTPEASGAENLLRTLQIVAALAAGAWILGGWARS